MWLGNSLKQQQQHTWIAVSYQACMLDISQHPILCSLARLVLLQPTKSQLLQKALWLLQQSQPCMAAAAVMDVQNEQSGAFLPSQNSARRVRDPRAMRNDYGRLPYHLAVRKGLTWLAEMLDPSVPVRWDMQQSQVTYKASRGTEQAVDCMAWSCRGVSALS